MYSHFSLADGAEEYFAHTACDVCHTWIGGGRYDVVALVHGANGRTDVCELSVCVDCVLEVD
jgi:hypothetical protein